MPLISIKELKQKIKNFGFTLRCGVHQCLTKSIGISRKMSFSGSRGIEIDTKSNYDDLRNYIFKFDLLVNTVS